MKDNKFKLLVAKLTGELKDTDKKHLGKMLKEDPGLKEESELMERIWSDMDQYNHRKDIDNYKISKKSVWIYAGYAVAASVILFFGLLALYDKNIVIENNSDGLYTYILLDSTQIILDKGARLTYEVDLLGRFDRQVAFYGRGYFHVTKKDGQKFRVSCGNISVEVLGTKFDITTDSRNAVVTLEEGKIKLFDIKGLNDTAVVLKPSQQAVYYAKNKKLVIRTVNPKVYNLWTKERLYFDQFSMQDISQIIRLYYNKVLVFDDSSLTKKHIGGSAPADDYLLILKALSIITESDYYISNDTIYFKHKQK